MTKAERNARILTLERGMMACITVLEMIRKELEQLKRGLA